MTYDFDFFDAPVERPDSLQWHCYPGDVIPLWIADMDFRACEEITQALVQRAREGSFGYAQVSEQAIDAMRAYHREQYGLEIPREWVVPLPGVVSGLHLFCAHLHKVAPTRPRVLIGEPVYHHFPTAATQEGLIETRLPLNLSGAPLPSLTDEMAREASGWLFCNPENPLGHAWSPAELRQVLDYASAHDLLLASDEIHGGLVLDAPYRYTPFLSVAKDDAERNRLVTLLAPSKTWNIAGIACAFAVLPDPDLRQSFARDNHLILPYINLFSWVAVEAAYRHGEPWRLGLLAYLRRNREALTKAAAQWGLTLHPLQATHLAFLDCRPLLPYLNGLTPKAFFLKHGVALHDGALFGASGWVRINIATQYTRLLNALERMGNAIASLPRP